MKSPRQHTIARGRVPSAPRPEAWKPADYEPEDAHAVQAVMYGRASEDQQKRAMRFITQNICGVYDQQFRPAEFDPDGRATWFAMGKRQVALEMIKFAQLNIAQLRGKQTEQGETPKEQT